MAYEVNRFLDTTLSVSDTGKITIVDDGLNNETSLALVGKYYVGYGETIAQNSLSLLENFASETAPSNPIEGQLWWQPSAQILNVRHAQDWLTLDATSGLVKVKDSAWTAVAPVFKNVLIQRANSTPVSLASSEDTDWDIHFSDPLHKWFRNDGAGTVSTDGSNVATIKATIINRISIESCYLTKYIKSDSVNLNRVKSIKKKNFEYKNIS